MSSNLSSARISTPSMSFEELQNNLNVFASLPKDTGIYISGNCFKVDNRYFADLRKKFNAFNLTCGFDTGDVKKILYKMKESIEYYKNQLPETSEMDVKNFNESVLWFAYQWNDFCTEYYEKKKKNETKSTELKNFFSESIGLYMSTIEERIRTTIKLNYSLKKKETDLDKEIENSREEKKKNSKSDASAVLQRGISSRMVDFVHEKEKVLKKPKKEKSGKGKWAVEEEKNGLSLSPSEPILSKYPPQPHSYSAISKQITPSPLVKWREAEWLYDQRRNSLALKSGLMTRRNSLKFDDIIHGTIWRREVGNHNKNVSEALHSIETFFKEKIYGNTMSKKLFQVSEQWHLAKNFLNDAREKVKELGAFIDNEIEHREQKLDPLKKSYKAAQEEYEEINKKVDKLKKCIQSIHETIEMMTSIIKSAEEPSERMKELKGTLEKNSEDLNKEVCHRTEVNERYKKTQEEFDLLKRELNDKILIISRMDKEFTELFDRVKKHFLSALDLYEKMPADINL